MKRREIDLHVSDGAVLRYLRRRHGVDTEAVRRHLAGLAVTAAELGAVSVRADAVRLFLREVDIGDGRVQVAVTTVELPERRRSRSRPEQDDG